MSGQKQTIQNLNLKSDAHRVGLGFSVQFALRAGQLQTTWTPHVPTGMDKRRVIDKYRLARDSFFADIAKRTGSNVACIEMPA